MNLGPLAIFMQDTELVPRSTRAAINSISVPTHGNGVSLGLSTSVVELFERDFTLLVDGEAKHYSIEGGGTVWELRFDTDWITEGQTVTLAYHGSQALRFETTPIDNNSIVTPRAVSMAQQARSFCMHFNMATYTVLLDSDQWAPGDADPDLFNPTGLTTPEDLDNWMDAAEAFGARSIMITTKHVDGFCLWPSTVALRDVTDATTWWAASGFDIVQAFVDHARLRGLKVGFYFSAWDRAFEIANPDPSDEAYTGYIQDLLTELLTNYGPIDEVLFDAWGITENFPSYTKVDKTSTLALVRSLQPDTVVHFNDYNQVLGDKDVVLYEAGLGPVIEMPPATNRLPARTWMTPTNTGNSWFDDPDHRVNYLTAEAHLARIATAFGRQSEVMFNLSQDVTGLIDADRIAYLASLNP